MGVEPGLARMESLYSSARLLKHMLLVGVANILAITVDPPLLVMKTHILKWGFK